MEIMPKEKNSRSSKLQIQMLLQYMHEHPDFAAGEYCSAQGAQTNQRQWEALVELLNNNGLIRSLEKWKTCWRDQKRKARVEGGALSRSMQKTGNPSSPVPELSENAALVLDTIGYQMAVGTGADEAPVGFSGTDSVPDPAPEKSMASAGKKRARRALPPDRFIECQKKTNNILKDINQNLKDIKQVLEEGNLLKKLKLQTQGVRTPNSEEILYVIEEE